MVSSPAEKFKSEWHEKMAQLLETNVPDDDVESNRLAQMAFL